jgi:D-alanine-D-alanine ligase
LWLESLTASIPGEIVCKKWFYDYKAKYITDEIGLDAPAILDKKTISTVQELAIKTFKAMDCEIMSRVDMFLTKDWKLFINELNTLPWFTSISMYPKLMSITWIEYTKLIDKLIDLAIDRKNRDSRIKIL